MYLNSATHITYFEYPKLWIYNEETENDEESDEYEEWEYVRDYLIDSISSAVDGYIEEPSKATWENKEVFILLENDFCEIGISEYNGLVSLSIRPNEHVTNRCEPEDYDKIYDEQIEWIDNNWDKICEAIPYKQYNRIGRFSNGESIYEPSK